jgi:hypothetical protein
MGEGSPGWHDEASMAVVGINAHTLPADLLRACLEALGIIPDVAHVPVELGAPSCQKRGATLSTNKVQNASENSTGHF